VSLVLDAGALIAIERADREVVLFIRRARERDEAIAIPAAVLGQVWRGGPRQAPIARVLSAPQVRVVPLDHLRAREAGLLCGATGTADVVDASVVCLARSERSAIVTSDPNDLRRLDPSIRLIVV
jgi:PIN domain